MDSNFSSNPEKKGSGQHHSDIPGIIVLHNDHVNTFEFVMDTLEEVCSHSAIQAEQCAIIAHYKGQCDILQGSLSHLKEIRIKLISKGLKVTIE